MTLPCRTWGSFTNLKKKNLLSIETFARCTIDLIDFDLDTSYES